MPKFQLLHLVACALFGVACQPESDTRETFRAPEVTTTEMGQLTLGDTIRKAIAGGMIHVYTAAIDPGDYFHVAAKQLGVDIKLRFQSPGGSNEEVFDSPTGLLGTENLHHLGTSGGDYKIEVESLSLYAEKGTYELTLKTIRSPTPTDSLWMQAYEIRRKADVLRRKKETREESLTLYDSVVRRWNAIGDQYEAADATRALGFAQRSLGLTDEAEETFLSLVPEWKALNDLRAEAFTYLILAGFAKNRKAYDSAMSLTLKSIDIWQTVGDLVQETKALSDIASFYMMKGTHQEAKAHYQTILDMAQETGSLSIQATMYRENGNAWKTFGDDEKVIGFYKKSLQSYQKMGHLPLQAYTWGLLGDSFAETGKDADATQSYQNALDIWVDLNNEGQAENVKGKLANL